MHYYRCSATHEETRWAAAGGVFCWLCGAAGRPFTALTITAIDAFTRDLDDVLAAMPGDAA
jgi:hypothetical protein